MYQKETEKWFLNKKYKLKNNDKLQQVIDKA